MPPAGPRAPGWTGPAQIVPVTEGWDGPTAAPGKTTPGKALRAGREENGKWQRKSLGKDGKTIMIICLE